MSTKKPTKSYKKKISMLEFRAWLQGVEELQSDDWTPTKEQWKLIRNKINTIDVSISLNSVDKESNSQQFNGLRTPTRMPFAPPPPVPGGVPLHLPVVPGAGVPGGPAALTSPDGTFRTPNIDNTKGYDSTFS